jgi:uncharacterized membrane protein
MTEQPPPPPGNYPPPPGGGYPPPPPPPGGGYPPPPPPPGGGYPPPPPPGGGYPPPPPPPGGGYPPPPPPGGGYPPPPPPPGGGYPPPPGGFAPAGGPGFGGAQSYTVGDAFSWAWNKFIKDAVPLIVPTVVYGLIVGVLYGIVYGLAIALAPDAVSTYNSSDGSVSTSSSIAFGPASIAVWVVGGIVLLVVGAVIASAYIGGLLDIANGQPVTIGSFFKPRNVGSVIIASAIVAVLTSIGYALCVIPGLVVAIFTMFTTVALIDRNLSPVDAIKASVAITRANFGQVLLAWVIIAAITLVGSLVCGFGLLVALPVASLFLVYAYRRLSGGELAPLTA